MGFGQNTAVTTTVGFNGEPTLAVNPMNPQVLVAAWIGVELGQKGVIRTSFSLDGGVTWSASIYVPHTITGNTSADPSLQYNAQGEVFLCYIDYDATNFSNGQILVRKSTDNATSWGNAVEAIAISDCPNQMCVDRPWMEIDRSGSVNDGTIYVTSMNANQPTLVTAPYHPYLAVSDDKGQSFATPRFLDTLNYLVGSTIPQPMPSPAIGADGTFYASYPSYETAQSPFGYYYLAHSTSQGKEVDHTILYKITIPGVTDNLAKKAGKLIADPSKPKHLVMLYLSELHGDADVFYQETFDAVVWTDPKRLNQDPIANGKMQDLVWGEFNAQGDLAICWRDRRNASGTGYQTETEIYGTVRMKDSSQFTTDFPLSSEQVAHAAILDGKANDFLSTRFVGRYVYTVWGDVRTGTLNIYLNTYDVEKGTAAITQIHNEAGILRVAPNPVNETLRLLHFDQVSEVELFQANGTFVRRIQQAEEVVADLLSGTYLLRYTVNGKSFVCNFVKL